MVNCHGAFEYDINKAFCGKPDYLPSSFSHISSTEAMVVSIS